MRLCLFLPVSSTAKLTPAGFGLQISIQPQEYSCNCFVSFLKEKCHNFVIPAS